MRRLMTADGHYRATLAGAAILATAVLAGSPGAADLAGAANERNKGVKPPKVLIVTATEAKKRGSLAKLRRAPSSSRPPGAKGLRRCTVRTRKAADGEADPPRRRRRFRHRRGNDPQPRGGGRAQPPRARGRGVVLVGSSVRLQPRSQDFVTLVGAEPGGDGRPQDRAGAVRRPRAPAERATAAPLGRRRARGCRSRRTPAGRVHVLGWVDEKSYEPGEGLAHGRRAPGELVP